MEENQAGTFGGFTVEELKKYAEQEKAIKKALKTAYDAGVVTKPEKVKKVKATDARIIFIGEQFKVILEENIDDINNLFAETITTDKPKGQKGINVTIEGCEYNIQILNKAAFAYDQKQAKLKREAAKKATETKGEPIS